MREPWDPTDLVLQRTAFGLVPRTRFPLLPRLGESLETTLLLDTGDALRASFNTVHFD